jgi:hypothetical protein
VGGYEKFLTFATQQLFRFLANAKKMTFSLPGNIGTCYLPMGEKFTHLTRSEVFILWLSTEEFVHQAVADKGDARQSNSPQV